MTAWRSSSSLKTSIGRQPWRRQQQQQARAFSTKFSVAYADRLLLRRRRRRQGAPGADVVVVGRGSEAWAGGSRGAQCSSLPAKKGHCNHHHPPDAPGSSSAGSSSSPSSATQAGASSPPPPTTRPYYDHYCHRHIWSGHWEDYDPWDATGRLDERERPPRFSAAGTTRAAEQQQQQHDDDDDSSNTNNSVFRMFQGMLLLSGSSGTTTTTTPATRISCPPPPPPLPLKLATAYRLLRPLFLSRRPSPCACSSSSLSSLPSPSSYPSPSPTPTETSMTPSPTPTTTTTMSTSSSSTTASSLSRDFLANTNINHDDMKKVSAAAAAVETPPSWLLNPGDYILWHPDVRFCCCSCCSPAAAAAAAVFRRSNDQESDEHDNNNDQQQSHVSPNKTYFHSSSFLVNDEQQHRGNPILLSVPVCPLTRENAQFLARQRRAFVLGFPGPEFAASGGVGESGYLGRPGVQEIYDVGGEEGLRAMGLLAWDEEEESNSTLAGERHLLRAANAILFPDLGGSIPR